MNKTYFFLRSFCQLAGHTAICSAGLAVKIVCHMLGACIVFLCLRNRKDVGAGRMEPEPDSVVF